AETRRPRSISLGALRLGAVLPRRGLERLLTRGELLGIEDILQHLARLEGEYATRADRDRFACLRVATDAALLLAHHEITEARNLHAIAAGERLLHGLEYCLDDLSRLLLGKPANLLVHAIDDFGLCHRCLPFDCPPFDHKPLWKTRPPSRK